MRLKKVRIYWNENSSNVRDSLISELSKRNFVVVSDKDENIDLAIAVGGDGTFLHMVREEEFNSNIYFVGIHTGTLGFLQNVPNDKLSLFVENLANDNFLVDDISIEKTTVYCNGREFSCYAINEVVIRGEEDKCINVRVEINDSFLENFSGDGILVATTVGSSAHNCSYNGAIVDRSIETLQITPMGSLKNSEYANLTNSLITSGKSIVNIIYSDRAKLRLSFDSKALVLDDIDDVERVSIELSGKIHTLLFGERDYVKTINQKLLRKVK